MLATDSVSVLIAVGGHLKSGRGQDHLYPSPDSLVLKPLLLDSHSLVKVPCFSFH